MCNIWKKKYADIFSYETEQDHTEVQDNVTFVMYLNLTHTQSSASLFPLGMLFTSEWSDKTIRLHNHFVNSDHHHR